MVCAGLCTNPARAGGGPENVLVVVNPRSEESRAVADHYVRLRQIPECNVLKIEWAPDQLSTDVDTFRMGILGPLLAAIESRGLAGQIDCVAYAPGFPCEIDARADAKRSVQGPPVRWRDVGQADADELAGWPPILNPTCSITGLTCLYQRVMDRDPAYLGLHTNRYMRRPVPQQKGAPSLGFRGSLRFGPHGEIADHGSSYLLCVVLGVTGGRGNTVEEILRYLDRAAASDGSRPKGTIYFLRSGDIRSRVRQRAFAPAARELLRAGVAAEIVDGILPRGKRDVQGAMIGTAEFDWTSSESTILPGAICEHLTSFGGDLSTDAGQTPLVEWLRHGAAGASGTVCEPFAIQDKFPLATIHVHYARGCTLAEAFYQSVFGPFQLLVVGDPLCRPWARIPRVSVEGVAAQATVSGRIVVTPSAVVPGGGRIDRFELFLDGRRRHACAPGARFTWDTTELDDGPHELRVVAIAAGPIQSQGRVVMPIRIGNRDRGMNGTRAPPDEATSIDQDLAGHAGVAEPGANPCRALAAPATAVPRGRAGSP